MSQAQLSEGDVQLLRSLAIGHVATLMPDGSPQVTPVWIDVDAETGVVLVNTAEGRAKVANVARDARVALSVTAPQDPYRALMIRGRVEEATHEGAAEHIDFVNEKYHGTRPFPGHDPSRPRVLLKIRPEHIARYG